VAIDQILMVKKVNKKPITPNHLAIGRHFVCLAWGNDSPAYGTIPWWLLHQGFHPWDILLKNYIYHSRHTKGIKAIAVQGQNWTVFCF